MPKAAKPAKTSASRDLIATGSKEVSKHYGKREGNSSERPTTTRALILRHSKYGAYGEGQVVLMSKMMGREKLDLLAEDLVKKTSMAVMAPFQIEQCIKIAESLCGRYLDEIRNLKDEDVFCAIIEEEIKARIPRATDKKDQNNDPLRDDPLFIAGVIADKIHNAYLLASGWKLVTESLYTLEAAGLRDNKVVRQLKEDKDLRSRYLVTYDLVNMLVDLGQVKFSVLATTTSHYAKYFKEVENELGEKQIQFDWQELRSACTSFLDSIIVELCFPHGAYPKAILYQILHDAVGEAPKEAWRFPQLLWDSAGDLSVAVQLQQLFETPLLGEDQAWKIESRKQPEEFDFWTNAQQYSAAATDKCAIWIDEVFPLHKTKKPEVLNKLWTMINANYESVSGEDIDTLWQVFDVLEPRPQWHHYSIRRSDDDDSSDDDDGPPSPKTLAIENRSESDSDSMPPLQDASDSDSGLDFYEDSDKNESDSEDSDEGGYNTDQEDEIREMLREAMDVAHEVDWDEEPEDVRKGNPFLKLLGSLRGRMFSNSSKLKAVPAGAKALPKPAPPKEQTISAAPQPGSQMATVEEVEDEGDVVHGSKKKKKKKPKKKTTIPTTETAPSTATLPSTSPASSPVKTPPSKTTSTKPATTPKAPPLAGQSSFSLPVLERTETAQSARTYVQSLPQAKEKLKSRGKEASLFSTVKRKFGYSKDMKETPAEKKEKRNWFAALGRKTRTYMHRILNTSEDETKGKASMRWDTFVKVMQDLGFKHVPSVAGSSVRFDPPDPRDHPITFHRPHPESTIPPIMLKQFGKRLRDHYGWTAEDLTP